LHYMFDLTTTYIFDGLSSFLGLEVFFFFSFLFSQLHWLFESKFLNPTRSNAWVPGFDRVARVNPYLKKSKQRRFSKKIKVNGLQSGFWPVFTGSTCRVTLGHDFSYFFFNPTRLQPRAGSGFKTMVWVLVC
jgi:hypothetical protein